MTAQKVRSDMTKNELKKYVEALIAAPSCCPEAKDAGEKYLAALGTEEEAAAGKNLLAELEIDITTIDDLIGLCESDEGRNMFGAEQAAAMAKQAREHKEKGGKYCICPACQNAARLLENEKDI